MEQHRRAKGGGGAVERPLDWSSAGEQGVEAVQLPSINWSSSGVPKKLVEYRRALIYDGQQGGGGISAE
jgi:hypothetical protein